MLLVITLKSVVRFLYKKLIYFIQLLIFNTKCSLFFQLRGGGAGGRDYFWIFGEVGAQRGAGQTWEVNMTWTFVFLDKNQSKTDVKKCKRKIMTSPERISTFKAFCLNLYVLLLKIILFKDFKNGFQKDQLSAVDFKL